MQFSPPLPDPNQPLNQQAFVPGLPYNHQLQIQGLQLSNNMSQLSSLVIGHSINAVQQAVSKNPVRVFYFNIVSRNGWNNPEILLLIQGVAELSEFYIVMNQMPPEQAIATASEQMASWLTCMVIKQFSQQLQHMVTPGMLQDTNVKLQEFNAATNAVQRMYQTAPQQQQQFNNQGFPQQQQQFNNNRGYQPQGGLGVRGGAAAGPVGDMWGRNNPAAMGNRNTGGPSMWDTGSNEQVRGSSIGRGLGPRVTTNPQVEELTLAPDGTTTHETWNHTKLQQGNRNSNIPPAPGAAHSQPQTFVNTPSQPSGGSVFDSGQAIASDSLPELTHVRADPDSEWPKINNNPERQYDSVLLENGSELRPACISGWKKTFSEDAPYHIVYDPTTHVLFHLRRADGTVEETLKEKTPLMDYLANELDPKLRAAAKARQDASSDQVIGIDWKMAQVLRPHPLMPVAVPQIVSGPDTSSDLPGSEPAEVATSVFTAHSLAEAEVILRVTSNADATIKSDNGLIEFYFDEIMPMDVNPEGTLDILIKLEQAISYEELLKLIGDHSAGISEPLLKIIDQRMTNVVVESMRKNMSMEDWGIDSFLSDYNDLIEALEARYSEGLLEVFREHAEENISAALSTLHGEDQFNYLNNLGGLDDELAMAGKDDSTYVVFRSRTSVTRVPWALADLKLDLTNGGFVPERTMPELYKAMDSIFDRTVDLPVTYAHRYIQTSDKKLLELRRGYFGTDCLLLHAID